MKPHKVVFRKAAQADLRTIFSYVLEKSGSSGTALKYVRRIQRKCEEIGIAPLAHLERPDIWPGLRMAVFERRIVSLRRSKRDHPHHEYSVGKQELSVLDAN
ncbi:type II toxin-antitoxin system RelE/ParE family toxin [Pararhizobium sp. DWP3-4]|uniref:type II toxin-antitoxin system RelE/ParE family toxin n=1 Tax=Pararhizobium sp. DWP3-4 TaxID=2804565 RepID=UPI003CF17444